MDLGTNFYSKITLREASFTDYILGDVQFTSNVCDAFSLKKPNQWIRIKVFIVSLLQKQQDITLSTSMLQFLLEFLGS